MDSRARDGSKSTSLKNSSVARRIEPPGQAEVGHGARDSVVAEFSYDHPVFSLDALNAQKQLYRIQGRDRLWFAGAWTGYGFHEDGMRSGVEVARALGAQVPWEHQAEASRDLTLVPQIVPEAA